MGWDNLDQTEAMIRWKTYQVMIILKAKVIVIKVFFLIYGKKKLN